MTQYNIDVKEDLLIMLKKASKPKHRTTLSNLMKIKSIKESRHSKLSFNDDSDDTELTPHLVGRGITLRQLRLILDKLPSLYEQQNWKDDKHEQLLQSNITLHHLEKYFLKPISTSGTSFADIINENYDAKARWYVTCAKSTRFEELLACLAQHGIDFGRNSDDEDNQNGGGMTEDTPIWISSFCVDLDRKYEPKELENVKALTSSNKNSIIIIDQDGKSFGTDIDIKAIFEMNVDTACSSNSVTLYTSHRHEAYIEEHEYREAVGISIIGATSDELPLHTYRREKQFPSDLLEKFFCSKEENKESLGNSLRRGLQSGPAVVQWALAENKTVILDELANSLEILELYDRPSGPDFIRSLAAFIKICKRLEHIKIENVLTKKHNIIDSDIRDLARAIKEKEISMDNLELWGTDPYYLRILIEEEALLSLYKQIGECATRFDLLYDEENPDFSKIIFLQRAYLISDNPVSDLGSKTIKATLDWARELRDSEISAYLQSPEGAFLKRVLNLRFCQNFVICTTMLSLVLQVFIVCGVSTFSFDKENNGIAGWQLPLIVIPQVIIVLMEILQIMFNANFRDYITSGKNFFDIFQVVMIVLYVLFLLKADDNAKMWKAYIAVTTIAVAWIRLLFSLSYVLYPLSIFIYALNQILFELIPFLFTTIMLTFMFGQMFHVAQQTQDFDTEEPSFKQPSYDGTAMGAFMYSVQLLLSSLVWFPGDDEMGITTLEYILMLLYAFVIGLLLLNVIIAIVSNAFTNVQDHALKAVWIFRLSLVAEVGPTARAITSALRWLKQRNILVIRKSHKKKKKQDRFDFSNGKIPQGPSQSLRDLIFWWRRTDDNENGNELPKLMLSLLQRLKLFYKYAPLEQIVIPGPEFQKILIGASTKISWRIFVHISTLFFFVLNIFLIFIHFLLGVFTFGLLWPQEMRRFFFYLNDGSNSNFITDDSDKIDEQSHKIDEQHKMMMELVEQTKSNAQMRKTIDEQHQKITELYEKLNKQNEIIIESQKQVHDTESTNYLYSKLRNVVG